jgi:hypothetical protein
VKVGVVANVVVADGVTVTYAIPVMPVAPVSRGMRRALWIAGAGDGEVLNVMVSVPPPDVAAGNPTVADRSPVIGANEALAGAGPAVTVVVVEDGYVAPTGGAELLPLLQPATNAAARRTGNQ